MVGARKAKSCFDSLSVCVFSRSLSLSVCLLVISPPFTFILSYPLFHLLLALTIITPLPSQLRGKPQDYPHRNGYLLSSRELQHKIEQPLRKAVADLRTKNDHAWIKACGLAAEDYTQQVRERADRTKKNKVARANRRTCGYTHPPHACADATHEFYSNLLGVRLEGLAPPFGALPSRAAVRAQRGSHCESITIYPLSSVHIRGGFCHNLGAPSSEGGQPVPLSFPFPYASLQSLWVLALQGHNVWGGSTASSLAGPLLLSFVAIFRSI